jgi:hypothetical protein
MKTYPKILYLSWNDGSDTRIFKEVSTLVRSGAKVIFLGVGTDQASCFVSRIKPEKLYFVRAKRKSLLGFVRYFGWAAFLLIRHRYHSIHVVNEPHLLMLWPLLWGHRRVIVDIFDSVFLRRDLPGNRLRILKKCLFLPVDQIFVTDENRFKLMPDNLKYKTRILPNFTPHYKGEMQKITNSELTILYSGCLAKNRGTELIKGFLSSGLPLKVLAAGWVVDQETREVLTHPNVTWLGVLPQSEVIKIAATQIDFILCLYAPVNQNNINASPNKIFDGIQSGTPVIINAETEVAEFVSRFGLGYVLPSFSMKDYWGLYQELLRFKKRYRPNLSLKLQTSWERVEKKLLYAHALSPAE